MLNIDLWANAFQQLKVARAYDQGDCQCCKHRNFEFLNGKAGSSTITLCGSNSVQLTHKQSAATLDFDELGKRLRRHGKVTSNRFMIRADITDNGKPYQLTVFSDGRAIVKGTREGNVARSVYAKYVGA
jgi:adenylyltransferase/sulfurtransferase